MTVLPPELLLRAQMVMLDPDSEVAGLVVRDLLRFMQVLMKRSECTCGRDPHSESCTVRIVAAEAPGIAVEEWRRANLFRVCLSQVVHAIADDSLVMGHLKVSAALDRARELLDNSPTSVRPGACDNDLPF